VKVRSGHSQTLPIAFVTEAKVSNGRMRESQFSSCKKLRVESINYFASLHRKRDGAKLFDVFGRVARQNNEIGIQTFGDSSQPV
jgi:hypothetical protein